MQTQEITTTAACEAGLCWRCRGTVRSLTSADGRQCEHPCHGGDDLATEAQLERDHDGTSHYWDI